MTWREIGLGGIAIAIIVAVAMADPIPQDALYHLFSDRRAFGGIPNVLDVGSNVPFLFVGIAGMRFILRQQAPQTAVMRTAWLIFFFGIAVTAFGSGYYHLKPNNTSLFWDRLPMTIGFMSLVAIIVAEYYSAALGKHVLGMLLTIGAASVVYWAYTESQGNGDLRPYAIVQFMPMVLIPLVLLLYPNRSDLQSYLWGMIGFYLAAKLLEHYDSQIFALGGYVSGHSLKHLVAALAPAYLLQGLRNREQIG